MSALAPIAAKIVRSDDRQNGPGATLGRMILAALGKAEFRPGRLDENPTTMLGPDLAAGLNGVSVVSVQQFLYFADKSSTPRCASY